MQRRFRRQLLTSNWSLLTGIASGFSVNINDIADYCQVIAQQGIGVAF